MADVWVVSWHGRESRRPTRRGLRALPIDPEEGFRLEDSDTADTDDLTRAEARAELAALTERIADLQARLYAEESRAVLVVLQGIDAAGKDSHGQACLRGLEPAGRPRVHVQGADRGGGRARLPLALSPRRACATG